MDLLINRHAITRFLSCAFGSIAVRAVTLLSAALALKLLTAAEFGVLSIANNFITIMAIFLGGGLRHYLGVIWYQCQHGNERKRVTNDLIVIYLALATPVCMGMLGNYRLVQRTIFLDQASLMVIVLSLFICFLSFFTELLYQALRFNGAIALLNKIQLAGAIVALVLQLIFCLYWHAGITGLLAGTSLSSCITVMCGYCLYRARTSLAHHNLIAGQVMRITRVHLTASISFIPAMAYLWGIALHDRWLLAHYCSLPTVGIFSCADFFGQLFQVCILWPLNNTLMPHLFEQFARNRQNAHLVQQAHMRVVCGLMLFFGSCITLIFWPMKSLLTLLLPVKFCPAIPYVWAVLMSNLFLVGAYGASWYVQFMRKDRLLLCCILLSCIVKIALNYTLIPATGIAGAVLATSIGFAVYCASVMLSAYWVMISSCRPNNELHQSLGQSMHQ